jgi:hypothetical protein
MRCCYCHRCITTFLTNSQHTVLSCKQLSCKQLYLSKLFVPVSDFAVVTSHASYHAMPLTLRPSVAALLLLTSVVQQAGAAVS